MWTTTCKHCGYHPVALNAEECRQCGGKNPAMRYMPLVKLGAILAAGGAVLYFL